MKSINKFILRVTWLIPLRVTVYKDDNTEKEYILPMINNDNNDFINELNKISKDGIIKLNPKEVLYYQYSHLFVLLIIHQNYGINQVVYVKIKDYQILIELDVFFI